ncbi:hypothetical protein DB346_09710 [Verrucomicrobia bacterium LW23]|nr:hypothetical protein DB346_09710 [Verrucomicrobia bacterium LW23]
MKATCTFVWADDSVTTGIYYADRQSDSKRFHWRGNLAVLSSVEEYLQDYLEEGVDPGCIKFACESILHNCNGKSLTIFGQGGVSICYDEPDPPHLLHTWIKIVWDIGMIYAALHTAESPSEQSDFRWDLCGYASEEQRDQLRGRLGALPTRLSSMELEAYCRQQAAKWGGHVLVDRTGPWPGEQFEGVIKGPGCYSTTCQAEWSPNSAHSGDTARYSIKLDQQNFRSFTHATPVFGSDLRPYGIQLPLIVDSYTMEAIACRVARESSSNPQILVDRHTAQEAPETAEILQVYRTASELEGGYCDDESVWQQLEREAWEAEAKALLQWETAQAALGQPAHWLGRSPSEVPVEDL